MKPLVQRFGTLVATIAAFCVPVLVATAQDDNIAWIRRGEMGHVWALAIDPVTPTTLYVSGVARMVLKSTDGGLTWRAPDSWDGWGDAVVALVIDPTTPSTLYAASYAGFWRTLDSGANWDIAYLSTSFLSALAIDPVMPSTIYAAAQWYDDQYSGGVFKSVDAGLTWNEADDGLPPSITYSGVSERTSVLVLAIDPFNPSTLYAGTGGYLDGHGVFKSTDAGLTWVATNTGLPPSTCVSALAINPSEPSILYAATSGPNCRRGAGMGLFKTTDAGASWNATALTTPAGVSALAIDPITPSTLYAGSYGDGVFKSTDAGSTWSAMNAGLTNTLVTAIAIDPLTPSRLYAGTSSGVFSIRQIACIGDCSDDGTITIDELVAGINIALGTRSIGECPSFDSGDDGRLTVDDLIAAVNNILNGCPAEDPA